MPPMAGSTTEREYYEAFSARLKATRQSLGWTQAQMAKALGVEYENFKKYEAGVRFPLHVIERLALVTQRSVDYWVTGKNVRQLRQAS
jgi:transcriptional regulator with XRE-family HTH domain